jgi:GTPase
VIREKAIALVREELPHSIAVVIEEMGPPEEVGEPRAAGPSDLLVIRATLFVERSSQKPIVLGRRGSLLREIGTRARAELEALLGTKIFLDLHVKIAKEWQRDPKQLSRLGY